MPKQAITVTLDADNLTWLKGRARGIGARSMSELLNRLVSDARRQGTLGEPRSVVGTVTIDPSDPLLDGADQAVRAFFAAAVKGAPRLSERPSAYRVRRTRTRRRG